MRSAGVSVVIAVLNEAAAVSALLEALRAQTVHPDEVLFADGGSTDETRSAIARSASSLPFPVRVLHVPGKIATGRNAAIEAAAHPFIAVTDADCTPSALWIESLRDRFAEGARAVAGAYRADARTSLQRAIGTFTWVPLPDNPDRCLPSHRSVGYERALWREIGGYNESIDSGEDTLFDLEVRKRCGFSLAPAAVVTWAPRKTLRSAIRQQVFYGGGDGNARSQLAYHAAIAAFIAAECCTFVPSVRLAGAVVFAAAFFYFLRKHVLLFRTLFPDALFVALLTIVLPVARLAGFVLGVNGISVRRLLLRS